jgi:WD40 repeat protein
VRVCVVADGSTLSLLAELPSAHGAAVYSVCFSPDRTKIVSGSAYWDIKLWGGRARLNVNAWRHDGGVCSR